MDNIDFKLSRIYYQGPEQKEGEWFSDEEDPNHEIISKYNRLSMFQPKMGNLFNFMPAREIDVPVEQGMIWRDFWVKDFDYDSHREEIERVMGMTLKEMNGSYYLE